MAEAIKRLSGPTAISGAPSSPTTLFTVPSKKLYVIRDVTMVARATSGAAAASRPTVLLGKTNVTTPGNIFFGQTLESVVGGYVTETGSIAIPFTENEVVVAAVDGLPAFVTTDQFQNSESLQFYISSSSNATSYASPGAAIVGTFPSNVYFFVANTKATTPDAISSITDAHTGSKMTGATSIATVATSTIRGSVWGGFANASSADSASWTVDFGAGTQTGCLAVGFTLNGAALELGAPSTSDVILQAVTNSGTTATSQGVTMTPTAGNVGFQILLVATEGAAPTYTAGTGGVELVDGPVIATPSAGAAVYLFDPPVTDPFATASVGGSNYVAVCLEIARGGYPISLTTSGVIIE